MNSAEPDSFSLLCAVCAEKSDICQLSSLSVEQWQDLMSVAVRHRVVSIFSEKLDLLNLDIPPEVSTRLKKYVKINLLFAMKLSAELVELTAYFEKNDIRFISFKGLALTHLSGQPLVRRHAGDIDILLIDVDDVVKADATLVQAGYHPTISQLNFSRRSPNTEHFLTYGKHVVYFHPQKQIRLEIHISLFNTGLFSASAEALYNDRAEIVIGNTRVPAMSKKDHLLYILVHGAASPWFRLKWLCDIPALSNNGQDYMTEEFRQYSKRLGLDRPSAQGLCLAHDLLDMPIPQFASSIRRSTWQIRVLVAMARRYLAAGSIPDDYKLSRRIGFFLVYLPLLSADWSYRFDVFKSYSRCESDWELLPLPEYLFWLYFPLRPFLWIARQYKKVRYQHRQ